MKIIKNQFRLMMFVALWLSSALIFAQELPVNPKLQIGKLENGFTYYLEENGLPANHIEFRLVVKAGSILEDEDQQGLAHFIEHMAFNGTKHFEKNSLISFLQKMGLRFGADLNAYTSFDETVYILPIPTDNPENVDKALTVLSDWAHQVTFAHEEIDKERGVIMEEWRTSQGAQDRMFRKIWPITLAGSRYGKRMPIGKTEIIQNGKYEALKRFYRDWYRPDLMGLIAVGNFKKADMEQRIKKHFGEIKLPENPRKREYYSTPDFKGTRVAIASDEEATENMINVEFTKPGTAPTKNTLPWLRKAILQDVYSVMIGQRLFELTQSGEPPFLYAYSSYGPTMLGKDKYAYNLAVSVKDSQFEQGLKKAMAAHERVRQFGFTEAEFEQTKALFINEYERGVKEDSKAKSAGMASYYLSHFLGGGTSPLLSASDGLKYVKQILPSIKLEEINALSEDFWGRSDNRVIQVTAKAADADKIPSKQRLIDILDKINQDESIEAYKDSKIDKPLMSLMPRPGSIVEESVDEETGIISMKLSNGVKVYLKPTDFKNDEVNMTASGLGGLSLYSADENMTVRHAGMAVDAMGVGPFNTIDFGKFMSGKTASVQTFIDLYGEDVSGFSSLKDLETFMQLLYLKFTTARKDEEAFKSWLSATKSAYANAAFGPDFKYQMRRQEIMLGKNNPWINIPTSEELDEIDLDRAIEVYKERFADASHFKFVFVGNIDLATFRPLLEQYVASLPSKDGKGFYKDLNLRVKSGKISENIYAGVDEKSQVDIVLSGDYKYSRENNNRMQAIANLLTNKMMETLREKMSGVYSASVICAPTPFPEPTFQFNISFPCKPENAEVLAQAALEELEKIKKGDFTEEDLQKIINAGKNNFDKQIKENGYWLSTMNAYLANGWSFKEIAEGKAKIEAVTKKSVIRTANRYLTSKNLIKTIKLPEGYEK